MSNPPLHLIILFGLEGVLLAVPFDLGTLAVVGGPVRLVEGVWGGFQYDVSDSGSLVYVPGPAGFDSLNLSFIDREGHAEVLSAPERGYLFPRFSPDDTRIAVQIVDAEGSNIWIFEIQAGLLNQLTFDGGQVPVWSPDGTEVTFLNGEALWAVPSDFSGTPVLLPGTEVAGHLVPVSWSPDGANLLFVSSSGLHVWRTDASQEPSETTELIVPSVDGVALEGPEFSPDGAWIAYSSNETGSEELYANPYPVGSGGRQRITTDGGRVRVWVRERPELIVQGRDNRLHAMEMTTQPTLARTNPLPLFAESNVGANCARFGITIRSFDVSADGQQFIVASAGEAQASPRINVVLDSGTEALGARQLIMGLIPGTTLGPH